MNMCFNTNCNNREVFAIDKHGECDTCGQGTLQFLWQFTSNSPALLTERGFFDKNKVCILCTFGEGKVTLSDGPGNACFTCGHSKQFTSNSSAIPQQFLSNSSLQLCTPWLIRLSTGTISSKCNRWPTNCLEDSSIFST